MTLIKSINKKKRINFDINQDTAAEFDEIIEAGNYNKSAILRGLVEDWIKQKRSEK